jgi:ribosomal protein L7/L12
VPSPVTNLARDWELLKQSFKFGASFKQPTQSLARLVTGGAFAEQQAAINSAICVGKFEDIMDESREGLVLLLLEQGGRSQAIKVYQEETGAALEEAKIAVASLANKHGIMPNRTAWFAAILTALSAMFGSLLAF